VAKSFEIFSFTCVGDSIIQEVVGFYKTYGCILKAHFLSKSGSSMPELPLSVSAVFE
jgi:hypothetical protein